MKASVTLVHGNLMSVGAVEIVIVLAIALLVFGPERLPQMGRTLGRAMREFRRASGDITGAFSFTDDDVDEDEEQSREEARAAAAPREPAAATPLDAAAAASPEPDTETDDEANAAPREPAAPAAGGPGAA